MAEFEKELLIERILAGQARARSEGAVFGRKPTFGTADQRAAVLQRLADGISVSAVAREFGTSRQTVLRLRENAAV